MMNNKRSGVSFLIQYHRYHQDFVEGCIILYKEKVTCGRLVMIANKEWGF